MSKPADFSWLEQDLADRREQNLYRTRRRILSAQGAHVRWHDRDFVNFSSNDYLNLAGDPRLAEAASEEAATYGCGAGSSPLVSGHLPPLRDLERDLAQWEGVEQALVFSSGFVTNLAVISSLMGQQDAVYSDRLNHASLIEGCRHSKAAVHVYRHLDLDHLADLLAKTGRGGRRRLIVTDSVFSMDGHLVVLDQLLSLADAHDCLVLLDEAHATGVLGERGRGVTDLYPDVMENLGSRVIKVGTLSKALGAQGGFVCGPRVLIDWLVNFARPYVFSTALAPAIAAAARCSLSIVGDEPDRRTRLLQRADWVREQLQARGWDVGRSRCQIIPLLLGSSEGALSLSSKLEERGLLVPAIRPPSVPDGTARLRISLTAGHTDEDVQSLLAALSDSNADYADFRRNEFNVPNLR